MVSAQDHDADEGEAAAHLQAAPEALPPLHPARATPAAQQKASARSCVLTLVNCAVGAPLLSLPYAYQQTGWAAGIMLTVCIAAMEAFTLFALACHAEKTGSATYSALVRKMLGPAASVLLSLVTIAFAFGSCCAYLMILADCVQPMLEAVTAGSSVDAWWGRREAIIVLLGSGVMLPLSFPESLDALSGASSIALCGLVVIAGSIALKTLPLVCSPDYDWGGVAPLRFTPSFLDSLPILIYGFQSHTNVVAVFHELEDQPVLLPKIRSFASLASLPSVASLKQLAGGGRRDDKEVCSTELSAHASLDTEMPASAAAAAAAGTGSQASEASRCELLPDADQDQDLDLEDRQEAPPPPPPRSAKLQGMVHVVYTAIGLTAAMYCLLGVFGYLGLAKTEIGPNILDMYPATDPTIQVARLMLALIQLVSYPINLLPARAAIWHLLEAAVASRVQLRGFHTLSTLTFFGATLAVALSTTDLGMMFQLIGGTCGVVLIFGMPGGLLMGYAWKQHGAPRLVQKQEQEQEQQAECKLLAPGDPELGALQQKQAKDLAEGQLGEDEEEEEGLQVAAAARTPAWVLQPGWLASKLWWSGLALVLLTAALCVYSLHSVLAA